MLQAPTFTRQAVSKEGLKSLQVILDKSLEMLMAFCSVFYVEEGGQRVLRHLFGFMNKKAA